MPTIGDLPASMAGCPFCQGDRTSDLEECWTPANTGDCLRFVGPPGVPGACLREDFSKAGETSEAWALRICRNIFPVMSVPKGDFVDDGNPRGFVQDQGSLINACPEHPWYLQLAATGYNEVIVESPKHNWCIPIVPLVQVEYLINGILHRGRQLRGKPDVKYVTVFKQHKCGSLFHAHSQIISTPFVPELIELLATRAFLFQQHYHKCSVCSSLVDGPAGETLASERLVFQSQHFVVSVPFASRSPYRLLIAPKRHAADFFDISDEEAADLAHTLRRALSLYYHKLDDTAYNLAIFTCPVNLAAAEQLMYTDSHWYLALYPREKWGASGFGKVSAIIVIVSFLTLETATPIVTASVKK